MQSMAANARNVMPASNVHAPPRAVGLFSTGAPTGRECAIEFPSRHKNKRLKGAPASTVDAASAAMMRAQSMRPLIKVARGAPEKTENPAARSAAGAWDEAHMLPLELHTKPVSLTRAMGRRPGHRAPAGHRAHAARMEPNVSVGQPRQPVLAGCQYGGQASGAQSRIEVGIGLAGVV